MGLAQKPTLTDRYGKPLTYTLENRWNHQQTIEVPEIPQLLVEAFLISEDKRFYEHQGVDWLARLHAIWQALKSQKIVRGASTITEQVIRMTKPRPRTVWSRWLEGFEARMIEKSHTKKEILNFYLNQIPFGGRQRGIVAASWYYFDREIETLTLAESLALAVLVRSPTRFHPANHPKRLHSRIVQLAGRLLGKKKINREQFDQIKKSSIEPAKGSNNFESEHFARYVLSQLTPAEHNQKTILTSLDSRLQSAISQLLDERLQNLKKQGVKNGAVLVVDHNKNLIRAWAVAGSKNIKHPGRYFDTVLTARQPGSTLKPFLYARALDLGISAGRILNDEPIFTSVGQGMHVYRNYSRKYYGHITLTTALANSLNSAAILTGRLMAPNEFLDTLKLLGFSTIKNTQDFYGEGIVLGTPEVSLYSLVSAYTAFGNRGDLYKIDFRKNHPDNIKLGSVFSTETAAVISKILADPETRHLEFPGGGLDMGHEVAIKTGTSTAYRDAWSIGWDSSHTVGIWMGNLNRKETLGITGARGTGILLRSIFYEIYRDKKPKPLPRSPGIMQSHYCQVNDQLTPPNEHCLQKVMWRRKKVPLYISRPRKHAKPYLYQPAKNLSLAIDPRVPRQLQATPLEVRGNTTAATKFRWFINEELLAVTTKPQHVWQLAEGDHKLRVEIEYEKEVSIELGPRAFSVRP